MNPWIPWLVCGGIFVAGGHGLVPRVCAANSNAPVWLNQSGYPTGPTNDIWFWQMPAMFLHLLGDREIPLDEYADRHYSDRLIPKDSTEGELRLFHYLQSSQITSMADASCRLCSLGACWIPKDQHRHPVC